MTIAQIKIGTEAPIEIDTEAEAGITDLTDDMKTVAARIAWVGEVLGQVEQERRRHDKLYRGWRAKMALKFLRKDPKISEWKVKAKIEADEMFDRYKEAQSQIDYNATTLYNLISSLREKSQNLRSLGVRARSELEATGMSTRVTEAQQTAHERKAELRKLSEQNNGN